MTGRGSAIGAAGLLCAACSAALVADHAWGHATAAQQAPPASTAPELDPNAPLAPLPDLGVEWPDLNAKDTTPPPPAQEQAAPSAAKAAASADADASVNVRYTVQVEGLSSIVSAEDLLKTFRQSSTLEAERKKAANAAQIGRRANADADLLAQLLRRQGYYDAMVEPSTERADDT